MLADQFVELRRHLPKDVYMGENMVYADYHAQAITINGENSLHTLEYFAFHILWISFMQKITFALYRSDPNNVEIAFSNEGNILRALESAQNLYDLSVINEKKLCDIAKHPIIGFHRNKIDNLVDLINKRDHVAHCSGVLDLDKGDIVNLANTCIRYTKEIDQKLEPQVVSSWGAFVSESHMSAAYSLFHDAVVEFLRQECLSVSDIESILNSPPLAGEIAKLDSIGRMHLALIIEDYDIGTEVNAEYYKNIALSLVDSDDERDLVQDESEAYVRFRVGLSTAR